MEVTIDIRQFNETDRLIIIGEKGKVVIQNLDGFPANRLDAERLEGKSDLRQRRKSVLEDK